MNCPNCGNRLDGKGGHCPVCGAAVGPAPKKEAPRGLWMGILAVALVLLLAAGTVLVLWFAKLGPFGQSSPAPAVSQAAQGGGSRPSRSQVAQPSSAAAQPPATQDTPAYDDSWVRSRSIAILVNDERTAEEAMAIAEELYAFILASANPAATFEELLAAHNEDPGMDQNPEGYLYTEGTMLDEYYEAALKLQVGEISPPVYSTVGVYIIMRLPL